MKCNQCGFENKEGATFCIKCGSALKEPKTKSQSSEGKSDKSKYLILVLTIVIIILAAGYFALNSDFQSNVNDDDSQNLELSDNTSKNQSIESSENTAKTKEVKSKSWELIGSYSGSGSGYKNIEVPEGKIKVELSAYPTKNYDINHLYVSGPTEDKSGGVNWNSNSPVESRSDSFEFTLSSPETFIIDYYETESWEVEFYAYQ